MDEIRTFIAIEIPPEVIRALAGVQQQLRQTGAEVSWSRPEGMHLTLKFLGEIPATLAPVIGQTLCEVAASHAPFRLAVCGTGAFPNLHRPRVVWAGVTDGADTVRTLARAVDQALTGLGLRRDEKPYSPHLTLGRVHTQDGVAPMLTRLNAFAQESFGLVTVSAIRLMRSELGPQGARYTMLHRAPLLGDPSTTA